MLILIADAFDASLPDKLKKFGEVTSDINKLPEATVVLVRSKTKCTKEFIDKAPNLKLIIRGGVGTDNIDKEHAKKKNVQVANTPKASAISVAELAIAMMAAIPSKLIEGHNAMLQGKFLKNEIKRTELNNKTLGLIGIGNIASEVAMRAKAFNMKVIAYDKYVQQSAHAEMKTFDEVIAQSHYISLHTPLTDETRGMINAKVISTMKDGAVIINTCRAGVIEDNAVVEALKSGKLACYATDVYPSDPPPPEYPILKAPNVIMMPHVGGSTKENLLRIGVEVEEIIKKFVERTK